MTPVQLKLRAAVRARLIEIVEGAADPLSFLCSVIQDKSVDLETRVWAAALLLPHIAPRVSAVPLPASVPASGLDAAA